MVVKDNRISKTKHSKGSYHFNQASKTKVSLIGLFDEQMHYPSISDMNFVMYLVCMSVYSTIKPLLGVSGTMFGYEGLGCILLAYEFQVAC